MHVRNKLGLSDELVKLKDFQHSYFVCWGGRGKLVAEMCVSKYVSVLIRFEW